MPNSPTPLSIVFAGSFLEYSGFVLSALLDNPSCQVIGVITSPPHPQGRQKIMTPSPVAKLAIKAEVPVFTPDSLDAISWSEIRNSLGTTPDVLLTAGYGKLLPDDWLRWPTLAALNLHLSLLPKYRGANPAEWAILADEKESGVTLMTMSAEFDTGAVLAQASLPFSPDETRLTAYQKLYTLGATQIGTWLAAFQDHQLTTIPQPTVSPTPYAQRFQRDDARVGWQAVQAALHAQDKLATELSPRLQKIWDGTGQPHLAIFLERACRALAGFPGLWSEVNTVKGLKRLKILSCHVDQVSGHPTLVLDQVQLEGYQAAAWPQLKNLIEESDSMAQ